MRTYPFHTVRRRALPYFQHPASMVQSLCTDACQVNLLAFLVGLSITWAFLIGFFVALSSVDAIMLVGSCIAFAGVICLNLFKRSETANVLFYILLNVVSLIAFRSLPGTSTEAVLMYVFLISPVVFLFEKTTTRLFCMAIVVVRLIFFEINANYITHADDALLLTVGEGARLVFDNILLGLTIFMFILYAIKIYMVQRTQKKNAVFGQHMSHDLEVSYHAVASMIDHLKSKSDVGDQKMGHAVVIDELANASGFFRYILNNFLDFSRYERGEIENNHIEEIDLESELEKIVALYKYMADEKGVHIKLVKDDQMPGLVFSDKIKVTRIVINLLTNALNITTRGKMITMTVYWKNGPWELCVANEGAGLPPEQIRQLFNRFEPPTKAVGGKRLGLGLPITKQLVEALGGSIETTQRNLETCFTVAFPMAG